MLTEIYGSDRRAMAQVDALLTRVGIRRDGTLVSNRTDYLTAAELNAFADVQSAAVSSWGYVVCTDSRGKVREAGWDVDGTRDTRDWPRLLVR